MDMWSNLTTKTMGRTIDSNHNVRSSEVVMSWAIFWIRHAGGILHRIPPKRGHTVGEWGGVPVPQACGQPGGKQREVRNSAGAMRAVFYAILIPSIAAKRATADTTPSLHWCQGQPV